MRYLFELLKDNQTIPKSEIIGCLNSEKVEYKILDSNFDILLIETNADPKKIKNIGNRLAYTYHVDEFLFSCELDEKKLTNCIKNNPISKKGSIAIRYRKRTNNTDTQKYMKMITEIYPENKKVKLTNPDNEIRVIFSEKTIYAGVKLIEINRTDYESRRAHFRPFFSPISMHPKVARALINISCVKKGDTLYDPFCGTGGILLEAGLMGINVVGSDIEEKMIKGCKKTLDYYKIKNYKVFCSDIGKIGLKVKNVDAIVTDFPYGRCTTTKGENIEELYTRSFENIFKILKKGKKAVIGLSNKDIIDIGGEWLKLDEIHKIRVHKSLTRYFVVYKKP